MAANNKKFTIKGIGCLMAKIPGSTEVVTCGTMKDLKITLNVEIEEIFGGDGLFAIDDLVKSKSIDITATEARFDLDMLRLMMGNTGARSANDNYIHQLNELATIGGESNEVQTIAITNHCTSSGNLTFSYGTTDVTIGVLDTDTTEIAVAQKIYAALIANATIKNTFYITIVGDVITLTSKISGNISECTLGVASTGVTKIITTVSGGAGTANKVTPLYAASLYSSPDFQIRFKDTNMPLVQVDDSTPDAGKFYVESDGTLTFNATDNAKDIYMNYKRTETLADEDIYAIIKDEIPFYVTLVHQGIFTLKNNIKQGIETELYCCRARGSFSMDYATATAGTSTLSLKVLDPERSDKRLGIIKRFQVQ